MSSGRSACFLLSVNEQIHQSSAVAVQSCTNTLASSSPDGWSDLYIMDMRVSGTSGRVDLRDRLGHVVQTSSGASSFNVGIVVGVSSGFFRPGVACFAPLGSFFILINRVYRDDEQYKP
jgi:hypothetical protein